MKKIIILNGYPESGKDLFALYLSDILYSKHDISVDVVSSVEKVKQAATLLGWDGIKTKLNRNALSALKDLSSKFWDGPFKFMSAHIKNMKRDSCLVFMVREPEEIQRMVNEFPQIITVFMKRNSSARADNHADQNVQNYNYDYYINNNGTKDELYSLTKTFVECKLIDE